MLGAWVSADTVSLSQALPAVAICNPNTACFAGTFAWDGELYYLASDQGNATSRSYDAAGTFVSTETATGSGAINGTYFDGSVARYSTHDGSGNRVAAMNFGTGNDSHVFSPVSTSHTLP